MCLLELSLRLMPLLCFNSGNKCFLRSRFVSVRVPVFHVHDITSLEEREGNLPPFFVPGLFSVQFQDFWVEMT